MILCGGSETGSLPTTFYDIEYVYEGAGPILFAGSATLTKTLSYIGYGHAAITGSAGISVIFNYEGEGGITLGGKAGFGNYKFIMENSK